MKQAHQSEHTFERFCFQWDILELNHFNNFCLLLIHFLFDVITECWINITILHLCEYNKELTIFCKRFTMNWLTFIINQMKDKANNKNCNQRKIFNEKLTIAKFNYLAKIFTGTIIFTYNKKWIYCLYYCMFCYLICGGHSLVVVNCYFVLLSSFKPQIRSELSRKSIKSYHSFIEC